MRFLDALLRKNIEQAVLQAVASGASDTPTEIERTADGAETSGDPAQELSPGDALTDTLTRLDKIMSLYEKAAAEIEAAESALNLAIAECPSVSVQEAAKRLRDAAGVLVDVDDAIAPDATLMEEYLRVVA